MEKGEILIYEASDGNIKNDVLLEGETVWLTQEQMASLFGKGRSKIIEGNSIHYRVDKHIIRRLIDFYSELLS